MPENNNNDDESSPSRAGARAGGRDDGAAGEPPSACQGNELRAPFSATGAFLCKHRVPTCLARLGTDPARVSLSTQLHPGHEHGMDRK